VNEAAAAEVEKRLVHGSMASAGQAWILEQFETGIASIMARTRATTEGLVIFMVPCCMPMGRGMGMG
jgi:hypothetical protein